ncbi:hypothetical protein LWI28_017576 [Acer negundo]|uniref:Uncharacterized protein n=1 Tax=Acer negundo TaxID=4023 RepID=A0AAD5IFU9_ACENE|nr:hypothetical protein LWI28_017576 [Acer negundo]
MGGGLVNVHGGMDHCWSMGTYEIEKWTGANLRCQKQVVASHYVAAAVVARWSQTVTQGWQWLEQRSAVEVAGVTLMIVGGAAEDELLTRGRQKEANEWMVHGACTNSHSFQREKQSKATKPKSRPPPNILGYGAINLEKRKVGHGGSESSEESWTSYEKGFIRRESSKKGNVRSFIRLDLPNVELRPGQLSVYLGHNQIPIEA